MSSWTWRFPWCQGSPISPICQRSRSRRPTLPAWHGPSTLCLSAHSKAVGVCPQCPVQPLPCLVVGLEENVSTEFNSLHVLCVGPSVPDYLKRGSLARASRSSWSWSWCAWRGSFDDWLWKDWPCTAAARYQLAGHRPMVGVLGAEFGLSSSSSGDLKVQGVRWFLWLAAYTLIEPLVLVGQALAVDCWYEPRRTGIPWTPENSHE